jgi:hypothetical protein
MRSTGAAFDVTCSTGSPQVFSERNMETVGRELVTLDSDGSQIPVIVDDDLTRGTMVRRQMSMSSEEVKRRLNRG